MNFEAIRKALASGRHVFYGNDSYHVQEINGSYWITCTFNCYQIGLTQLDGTLNGKESEFYSR